MRDKQLAEDNVQETFLKAFKKMEFLESIEKIGAWLTVIARRTAIDYFRKVNKFNGIPLEDFILDHLGTVSYTSVESLVEADFLEELIMETMVHFPPEDKKILELKLKKGWKEKEIAAALNMNPSTVKSKIYRAKCKLRETLKKELKVA